MQVFLWKTLLAPKSKDKDRVRREFILNIILIALIVLSATAFLVNITQSLLYHRMAGENPLTAGLIFLIFGLSLFLSRNGKSYFAAFILVCSLIIVAIYVSYHWGADLPVGLLLFAFIIVMAGILLGTTSALVATAFSSFAIILFSYLEISGVTHPNRVRDLEPIRLADSVVHIIILMMLATVSWLFNRESEKTLKRARASEKELKLERDLLELKVEERTKELKRIQLEKVTQLYRFAEIGRLTAGFMHDLVNPISLISLNLHKLNSKSQQKEMAHINTLLKRAIHGTKYLENFVTTARKQLQNQEIQKIFTLNKEIKHVIQMLSYKITTAHITIIFEPTEIVKAYGNPIKFNQIAMNLILNAIDAYDVIHKENRIVKIHIENKKNNIYFSVQDFGVGIPPENINKVFDPFFTTKSIQKGTGIGLSITQDIIKQTFGGKILVTSNQKSGTIFTVTFPVNLKTTKS